MKFIELYDEVSNKYVDITPPSTYDLDYEDLDNGSYRSITQGDLNRTIVSKKWTKVELEYKNLTHSEVYNIMKLVNQYPLKAKITNPLYTDSSSSTKEMTMSCSRANLKMQENRKYTLKFNLVQSKKASGQ